LRIALGTAEVSDEERREENKMIGEIFFKIIMTSLLIVQNYTSLTIIHFWSK
jgi:hypothetical protein